MYIYGVDMYIYIYGVLCHIPLFVPNPFPSRLAMSQATFVQEFTAAIGFPNPSKLGSAWCQLEPIPF